MSICLQKLTQIIAKIGISSSLEEEILTAVKDEITPPKENKEESIVEESCISNEEHLFELEIEEDEEGISGDHHANKSYIEHNFQVSVRLDQFCFCFYFVNLHLQFLVSHISIHLKFHFVELNLNFCLVLLHRWLHWQFHYT